MSVADIATLLTVGVITVVFVLCTQDVNARYKDDVFFHGVRTMSKAATWEQRAAWLMAESICMVLYMATALAVYIVLH